jgi:hypothetical protein
MKKLLLTLCLLGVCVLHSEEENNSEEGERLAPGKELEILGLSTSPAPIDLAGAIRELITGVVESLEFGEEFVRKIAELQKTKPSGEYVEYWEDGEMKFTGSWKNGLAEGHIHGWYKNGDDAFKAFFKDGKKIGVQIAFYHYSLTGDHNKGGRLHVYNEEGKLHGEQETCYPNRRLEANIRFKNGVLEGTTTVYKRYKSGKVIEEEWYYEKGRLIPHKSRSKRIK